MLELIMSYVRAYATNVAKREEGQTMVEYALLLSLIALVVALAIPGVTTAIAGLFTAIAAAL
jgi:Flp pilus assembly pilin Flp